MPDKYQLSLVQTLPQAHHAIDIAILCDKVAVDRRKYCQLMLKRQ